MTRRLTALALALLLALSLSGCWEEEVPEEDDFWNDTAQDEPVSDEPLSTVSRFTLPYLTGQTFDPVDCIDGVQQVIGALLYEPLFTLDEHFEPQGVLCTAAEFNAETLTYTLTLRSDVLFSDGSPLTASDVLAVYRRAAESTRYGARFAHVTAMRLRSTNELLITLDRADARFPALLDIPIVKSGTEGELVPPGTGAYLYVSDADGAALLANSAWRGANALPLERIALFGAKDNDTAASLFTANSVHLLRTDPTGRDALAASGDVTVTAIPTASMQFLGFNTQRALLSDAAVRTAMSAVIRRDTLAQALLSGHARPAQLPIAPESPLYPADAEQTLTEAAYAAALESAGVTAARPRSLTLLVNEENSFRCAVAQSLSEQLSTENLTVTVQALAWSDYLAALERGSFDLYLGEVRLTADWDAGALLEAEGALNYGGFTSEPLTSALTDFLARGDAASAAAYGAAFAAETPFSPLLFRSEALLSPAGLIEGMAPTASTPFASLAHWQFHLSE